MLTPSREGAKTDIHLGDFASLREARLAAQRALAFSAPCMSAADRQDGCSRWRMGRRVDDPPPRYGGQRREAQAASAMSPMAAPSISLSTIDQENDAERSGMREIQHARIR